MNTWRGSDLIMTFWDLKEFLELHHSRIFIEIGIGRINCKIPKIFGRLKTKRILKKLKNQLPISTLLQQIGYLKWKECRKENRIIIEQMIPEYLDCERPI